MKVDNWEKFGTPEYTATLIIELCLGELERMSMQEFEIWLQHSWEEEEIVIGGITTKVEEKEKRAILHFLAFWYYRQNL